MRALMTGAAVVFCISAALSQTIQKGDFSADATSEGWTLDRGTGVRTYIVFVKFDRAFEAPPTVLVSLTAFEAGGNHEGAIRISSRAENITSAGFVIKLWTWGDSRVTSVGGSWIAIRQ